MLLLYIHGLSIKASHLSYQQVSWLNPYSWDGALEIHLLNSKLIAYGKTSAYITVGKSEVYVAWEFGDNGRWLALKIDAQKTTFRDLKLVHTELKNQSMDNGSVCTLLNNYL